jgi:glycosyltransferase involved in cell wall biosynthesis
VPHGIAPHFTRGDARADPPYILFVGEFDPRKRHDLAFAAVGALADQGLPHRLLVTGRIAPWFAEQMERLVAESPHPDRVEMLGHVDAPTLVRLYQEAAALVVTSRGEGFGLPALEAMACGTPVVAFANSATTEVLGDAGILVPDGDFEEFVRALSALVKDPVRIEELAEQGFERAKQFSWPASVAAHAEILAAAAT